MTVTSNHPVDKVRELQRKLFRAAKCNPGRRFHALFDRIWRGDVLLEAWKRVRSNRGAAGIDGATLKMIEQRGVGIVERPGPPELRVAAIGEIEGAHLEEDLQIQLKDNTLLYVDGRDGPSIDNQFPKPRSRRSANRESSRSRLRLRR